MPPSPSEEYKSLKRRRKDVWRTLKKDYGIASHIIEARITSGEDTTAGETGTSKDKETCQRACRQNTFWEAGQDIFLFKTKMTSKDHSTSKIKTMKNNSRQSMN